MKDCVPNYNNQSDYDERLRHRYYWGLAYGISIIAGIALAYVVVRGFPQLLLPAEASLLVNMGLLVLAMVNQYRLPPFHQPGGRPDVGVALQLSRLIFIALLLAPFCLTLGYLLDLALGPQWFQVGAIFFFADFVLAIILLAVSTRYPSTDSDVPITR